MTNLKEFMKNLEKRRDLFVAPDLPDTAWARALEKAKAAAHRLPAIATFPRAVVRAFSSYRVSIVLAASVAAVAAFLITALVNPRVPAKKSPSYSERGVPSERSKVRNVYWIEQL